MKDKYIVLIVGESGSGKSTICNELTTRYGLKQVESYTTRPMRYEGESGHIFVNDVEFDALDNMCAYTMFNGYKYGATQEQVDNADLYVIDLDGIDYFMAHYSGRKIPMVVYIKTPIYTRVKRMLKRGDTEDKIIERLSYDYVHFSGAIDYAIYTYDNDDGVHNISAISYDIYDKFFSE